MTNEWDQTSAYRRQYPGGQLRLPAALRGCRGPPAQGHPRPECDLPRYRLRAAVAPLRGASRRRPRRRARDRRPGAGHLRQPGGAGRVPGCGHRGDRCADVQLHHPEPAQGLDRPHPGGWQDLPLLREGRAGAGRRQAGDRRDLARRLLWR